jgi:hypothetical protein
MLFEKKIGRGKTIEKNGQGKCCLARRRQSGIGHQPSARAAKFSPPFGSTQK